MMTRTPTDLQLALARSLYRIDKWDPARDREQPFTWEQNRARYVADADRLLRTFEKDGLHLMFVSPQAND
jgi:hypothetical protein